MAEQVPVVPEARDRLFERSEDAVLVLDAQDRVVELNAAAEEATGYGAAEVSGRPVGRVLAGWPRVREAAGAPVEIAIEGDGGERYFAVSLSALHGEDEQATGSLVVMRDVTARKAAEGALRESEERFRIVYDTAPVSIWREDWSKVVEGIEGLEAEGVTDFAAYFRDHPEFVAEMLQAVEILDVNQWSVTMFEARHKADLMASLGKVFATPETLPGFVAELTAMATGQRTFRTEMTINTIRGGIRHILRTMAFPERGSGSGQVLVSTVDITEQRRSEEALRERQQLAAALNRINGAIHASFDTGEIMQRLISEGVAALGCETAAVSLRRAGHWQVSHVHGFPESLVGAEMDDDEERHTMLAIRSRRPVAIGDAFHDERVNPEHVRRHNVRAVLVASLIVRGEPFGALFFNYHSGPRAFSAAQVEFAGQLAATAAIALENGRLFEEHRRAEEKVEQQNAVLGAVNQILEATLTAATEEALGASCLEVVERITGSKFGFIGEIGADGLLHGVALSNPGWDACRMDEQVEHRPPAGGSALHGLYGRVLLDGVGFYTNDPNTHPDRIGTPPGHPPLTSFLGVPLLHKQQTIGMIALGNREGGYGQEQLETLEALAPAIGEAFMRKRAETEAEEGKRILASALNGFWIADHQGRLREVNDALCRMLGYSRAELLAMSVADVEARETPAEVLEHIAVLRQKGSGHFESQHRRKDGTILDVEVNATYLESGGGQVVIFCQDISERKRAEKALWENREWLRVTLSSIGDGVIATDAGGRVTFMNPMAEPLTGWTEEEALGEAIEAVFRTIDEKTRQPGEDLCERVLRERRPIEMSNNTALVTRDGGEIPIEDSAAPILDAGGEVAGVVLVFYDVTKKRRALQALRESEERLRRAQEIAHLGSWELDLESNRLTWSDEVYRIFGMQPQSFAATYEAFLEQVHPDDREAVDAAYSNSVRENRDSYEIEHRVVRRATGEIRTVHEKCEHWRNAEGQIVRSIGMVHDVTERKQWERELERLNRTLQARSHSDRALLHARTETEFMEDVCRIIVEDCGHAMVWIGFAEEDEYKSVRPVAYAGFEEGYLETLHLTWADTERGRGPTGMAVRTSQPSFCRNMLTDPQFEPWRKEALARGYASSLVLPLLEGGRAFGALTIYFREPDPFTEDEIALLQGLADDLAYGIRTLRLRDAHARAEQALRESEVRYRTLFNSMSEGFGLHEIVCDEEGRPCDYRFLEVNPAFETLTGLKREEVIGRTVLEVLPDTKPFWIEAYGRVALTGEPAHFEEYSAPLERTYEVWSFSPTAGQFATLFLDVTERKRAEDALRQAKEEWERTFDSVPDLIAILDDRFRILRANRPMAERLGLEPEQCIGHVCYECVHGLNRPPRLCPHARTVADGQEHVAEVHEEHLGGDFMVSTTPLFDPEGRQIGSVHVARDITERKRTEDALRESEERFRSLAEGLPELVWVSDAEGRATYLNPQYRAFAGEGEGAGAGEGKGAGGDAEGGAGEDWMELVHPEDRRQMDESWAEAMRSGSDFEGEYRLRRYDGQYRWFLVRCVLKRAPSGEIEGWIGAASDIHDQKLAEEVLEQRVRERTAELEASEERFRQLADNVHEVFWMLEPETQRVLYLSPAYDAIWGRPRGELYERPWALLDTIHPEDREGVEQGFTPAWQPYDGEFRILRPDGGLRWIQIRSFPIHNEAGEVYRLAGIATDRTEQKAAEAALLQAERLTTAGKLAASVAHEINNPLQAVVGCLGLAQGAIEGGRDPGHYLQIAHQEVQRTARIVSQLRSLGRPIQGGQKEPTDLNRLVEDVLALNKKHLQGRQIEVVWEPGEALPLLEVVPDAVRQVFLNLVLNAADAMPRGGQLRLGSAYRESPAGVGVVFADNGTGIAPEVLPHIFEAFYSTKSEGLGVGLYVCQEIVHQHGGRIEVESESGVGTTFRVWLPVAERE